MSVGRVPRALPWTPARTGAAPGLLREALRVAPLVALYVAICALAQPGPHPVRDEQDLLAAAARMLDGQVVPSGHVTDPRAYLWHGPGLVVFLAPLVRLHLPLVAIRFVEPVLLGCAVLLFHRLLRVRLGPRASLAWTYAFGLYVPFFSVLPHVHKEPLCILLVVAGMLALTRGLADGRRLPLAGAGLALGALTMVRLEYGWVTFALLAVAVLGWVRRRHSVTARRLVAVAAVGVAACAPWLVYTYSLTGRPLYWGSSSGLSLFWMSPTLPGQTGQWYAPDRVLGDRALAPYRPLFRRLQTCDPVRSDLWLRDRAAANIRARPAGYARNLAANVTRLFFAIPMRPLLAPLGLGAYLLVNSLLLIGLAWSAALLRRRRSAAPEAAPIAIFAAVAIAVHVPPSASPRMLLPIVPALVWLVAQASHGADGGRRLRAGTCDARRAKVVARKHPRDG